MNWLLIIGHLWFHFHLNIVLSSPCLTISQLLGLYILQVGKIHYISYTWVLPITWGWTSQVWGPSSCEGKGLCIRNIIYFLIYEVHLHVKRMTQVFETWYTSSYKFIEHKKFLFFLYLIIIPSKLEGWISTNKTA